MIQILNEVRGFIEKQQNSLIQNYVCNTDIKVGEIKSKNGRKAIIVIKAIYDEEEQEQEEYID